VYSVSFVNMAAARVLEGYEDFFQDMFADSDSDDGDFDNIDDEGEEDRVGHREVEFNHRFNVMWGNGSIQPTVVEFAGQTGPQLPLPASPEPIDAFSLLLPEDIMTAIINETNRYSTSSR
jgi:hypothetical protein